MNMNRSTPTSKRYVRDDGEEGVGEDVAGRGSVGQAEKGLKRRRAMEKSEELKENCHSISARHFPPHSLTLLSSTPLYPKQEMEYLADDELLAKYRADMQNSQDQWQLNLFLKAQTGTWSGVWSEYTPVPNGGANGETVLRMTNIYKGRQECVGDNEARTVSWRDLTLLHAADGGPLEPVVVAEHTMVPPMFRGGVGSMAADNVFSRSSVQAKEGGKEGEEVFEAETWIRQGNYRTRVSFYYESKGPDEAFEAHKVVVKKERWGKQGPTAEEPELFGSSGRGIYDTSARVSGSWELSLHGGLSLAFPPALPRGKKGAVIVDWTAGYMRFQADRIFDLPDGTLASLEVTQIGTEDSMRFKLPEEEEKEGGAAGLESAAAGGGEGGAAEES